VDQSADAYEPPPPFAPPGLRGAPLNEMYVLGRSTYPVAPMVPVALPPAAWHPGTGWVPARAPHRRTVEASMRRRTIAIVATVAVALLAVVAALAVSNPGPSQHTLTLPESAGAYVKLSTVTGSRISTIFGNNGTFSSIGTKDLAHAKVGIYGRGSLGTPTLLFVGFSASDSPTIGRQLHTEDASRVTAQVIDGAGASTAPLSVAAGPLGGSLQCSAVHVNGLDAQVGVWADADTLGVVLLFDPALSPSPEQTGGVTRTFRSVAEH
jgi:hypothetical protein